MDVCEVSAVDLRAALGRREVSAAEVLECVLDRADRLTEPLNPFAVRLDERAREAAARADAALADGSGGPLCGLPVTIKDSHYLAGVTAASGSRTLEDFVPARTSAAVERLQAAGAVIFAKTTTPEFCYLGITESPVNGRTSNPWDLGRTPGGSSGGAGAAVAAGLGPLALGGDGGGSIRIPAAFCGLVGFKPTFGSVPREPCSMGWKTLVSYGPLARSVNDARLALQTLAGWHARDRHSLVVDGLDTPAADPRSLRALVSEDLGFAPLDDDVRLAFRAVVGRLDDAGAELVEGTPGLGSSVVTWSTIATAEARYSEGAQYEQHRALLGEAAAEFIGHGGSVTREHYVSAQMAREAIHSAYADLFERSGASVLLTPTLGLEAFRHGSSHPHEIGGTTVEPPWLDWCGLLYDANLAGLPACAVPIGLGDDGLPVSLQVLGPRGHDAAVLAAAEAIERLVEFEAQPLAHLTTNPRS
jgi:Asp-tRNA(Asn)/Glu-tRNA(Gln) amidotransferase A subunit family amidase